MPEDWRDRMRRAALGRSDREDPLIRKSIIERRPGTTQIFFDRSVNGFGLKITAKDHVSFIFQRRVPGLRWAKRWTLEATTVAAAGAEASTLAAGHYTEVAERPAGNPQTLEAVVRDYMAVRGSKFKSAREFERSLRNHVLPVLGDRPYESIGKRDLAELKNRIVARGHPHAAHEVLKNLNTIWSKYYSELATDNFTWPKVRSPLEDLPKSNGRKLSEAEIAQVWSATFKLPPHRGAYFRFLLYTGLRRSSAGRITRAQIVGDVLHVPGARTKPAYELPLSEPAAALLQDHFPAGARWAFAPLGPWGPLKTALDGHLVGVAPFTIHHIRHTVRSLLSRVATPDTAERCLGHALTGIRGTYDHHDYAEETKKAMTALATLIDTITK